MRLLVASNGSAARRALFQVCAVALCSSAIGETIPAEARKTAWFVITPPRLTDSGPPVLACPVRPALDQGGEGPTLKSARQGAVLSANKIASASHSRVAAHTRRNPPPNPMPEMTLRVSDFASVEPSVMAKSKNVANEIFRHGDWRPCGSTAPCPGTTAT